MAINKDWRLAHTTFAPAPHLPIRALEIELAVCLPRKEPRNCGSPGPQGPGPHSLILFTQTNCGKTRTLAATIAAHRAPTRFLEAEGQ